MHFVVTDVVEEENDNDAVAESHKDANMQVMHHCTLKPSYYVVVGHHRAICIVCRTVLH